MFSHVQLFASPWTSARQASLSITNSQSLLKLISTESLMPSNHFILCFPLLLLPSIIPSSRGFVNETVLCIRWPNIGVSASASVFPLSIQDCFPIGWTTWISLQSKGLSRVFHTTVQKRSAFFIFHFSHPYMTIGKTTALIRQTFVGRVMFLLSDMLSRLVIACLPRSKHILFPWLQSPSAVILDPKKINSVSVSIVSPSISHEEIGPHAMILVF